MRRTAAARILRRSIAGSRLDGLRGSTAGAIPADVARRCMGTWPKIHPVRIRAVTMDVTGTLVSFRGSLSQHYLGSAAKCGVDLPQDAPIGPAFRQAYQEVSQRHPCFGHDKITGKQWWRECVVRSLELAGAHMSEPQKDQVFQRVYSVFGSQAAYERFDDAFPFLHWANRNDLACGLLSNADDRYGMYVVSFCF